MYSAGSRVPWRVPRGTRHSPPPKDVEGSLRDTSERLTLLVVLASSEQERWADFERGSEAARLTEREMKNNGNEHGRGAGVLEPATHGAITDNADFQH